MTDQNANTQAVLAELTRVGQIAAGILDGEEIKTIISDRAMHHLANPHPDHQYMAGDYFDVDHETFLRTKKLLTRLERLGKVPMDGSVWVRVPETDCVTVALHNGANHRYYDFGQLNLPTPPEMQAVFDSGEVTVAPQVEGDRTATVLAPIRDSLGDVVAIVELTAPLQSPPPAWN
ncbi:hypothetical protein LCGC14_2006260 [marine sediment metagenome]|uniref:Uncharacterized protein n=1 Tax=marine sediment metagenome TaxID=412755 RepID=A0A0F9F1Q5_9ZZZZ